METVLRKSILNKIDEVIQHHNVKIVRISLSHTEFKQFLLEVDHINNGSVTVGSLALNRQINLQESFSGFHVTYRSVCIQCDPQGEESNGENRICFEG